MNLIYLRTRTPKNRKFIKQKLRGDEAASIYDIEEGDCCLAPAHDGDADCLLTFANDVSPEMLEFIYASAALAGRTLNLN